MKKAIKKNSIAIIVPIVYLVIILLSTKISYTTVDDVPMMHILAGYKTGEPLGWTLYLNPILSKIIAQMYKIVPQICWHTIIQLIIICFSIIVINLYICKALCDPSKRGFIPKEIALCALLDGAFCWMMIRLHFYNPAIMAGCAAICIILLSDWNKKHWYLYGVFFTFLWTISVAYTFEVTKGLFCYLGLVILFKIIISSNQTKKHLVNCISRIVLVGVVAVLVALGLHTYFINSFVQTNGNEYVEWNIYRIKYQDYPITTYYEDPDLYDSMGWDENLYNLTRQLYYMDDAIDAYSLKGITAPQNITIKKDATEENKNEVENSKTGKGQSLGKDLSDAYEKMHKLFNSEREAKGLHALMLGMLIASILLIEKKKETIYYILLIVCCYIGSFILCMYLCYLGRFPMRAYAVIAFPELIILAYGIISLLKARWMTVAVVTKRGISCIRRNMSQYINTNENIHLDHVIKSNKKAIALCISFILSIVVLLNGYLYYAKLHHGTLASDYNTRIFQEEIKKENTVYSYAKDNPDKLIIYDWSSFAAYDPFPSINKGELKNLLPWGSSRYNSYAYRLQLSMNDLSQIKSEDFAQENIYFISNKSENIQILTAYLYDHYSIDQCFVADKLENGFLVLKYYASGNDYSTKAKRLQSKYEPLTNELLYKHTKGKINNQLISGIIVINEGINAGEEKKINISFDPKFRKYPSLVFTPVCEYGFASYLSGHTSGIGLDWATIVVRNTSSTWLPLTINWMAYGEQ